VSAFAAGAYLAEGAIDPAESGAIVLPYQEALEQPSAALVFVLEVEVYQPESLAT
jgi:hypothetical protein